MAIEYEIETYDTARCDLDSYLPTLPGFQSIVAGEGARFWKDKPREDGMPDIVVNLWSEKPIVTVYGDRNFGCMILGLIASKLLSSNDHIVISGG